MFGNRKSTSDSSLKNHIKSSSATKALNTIVNSTSIEGDIKSGNDIRIDGDLIGNLTCGAKVIIGPNGKVIGEINCIDAVIEGKFEGILTVKESLTLTSTAIVKGDIKTNKWIVQSGAAFNGACKMGNTTAPVNTGIKNKPLKKHKIVRREKAIAK